MCQFDLPSSFLLQSSRQLLPVILVLYSVMFLPLNIFPQTICPHAQPFVRWVSWQMRKCYKNIANYPSLQRHLVCADTYREKIFQIKGETGIVSASWILTVDYKRHNFTVLFCCWVCLKPVWSACLWFAPVHFLLVRRCSSAASDLK